MKIETEPCKTLKYCPYGPLVEYFPLDGVVHDRTLIKKADPKATQCPTYGHDCPAYYLAEKLPKEVL